MRKNLHKTASVYYFLLFLSCILFQTKVQANNPPKAPDCPALAIPQEFISANFSSVVVRNSANAVIANGRAQVGGYALYSNIGTVNIGNAAAVIDMKVTFVSTTGTDPSGYLEFGNNGNDARWRANNWNPNDIHNLAVEFFVNGTSTPANYSGIWNFTDLDKPSGAAERVYMPTNVLGNYLLSTSTKVSVSTSGSDYLFTGSGTSSGGTNPDYAFAAIVESVQSFNMKLQNGGGSTTFFFNGNNFNFIPSVCTNSDQFSTTEDATISKTAATGLLINDTDLDGDVLTVVGVQGSTANLAAFVTLPSGSVVKVNADGSFTYNPNPAFDFMNSGQTRRDSFYYQISDGHGGFDLGTVTVLITGINDAPVATDDAASTNKNVPVAINVLTNDTDVDGTVQASTLTISTAPGHGSTSVNTTTGVITYTPTTGYSGPDSYIYQVCDNGSPVLCDVATVNITVTNLCGIAVAAEPACPTAGSGGKTLAAGNVTFGTGDQGNYFFTGTSITSNTLTINVGTTNAVNIYICAGQTMNLTAITLTTGSLNFYIKGAGTLKLGAADLSAASYYVYGTLHLNSRKLTIQNGSSLNIASTPQGIVYSGSIDFAATADLSYVEGLLDVTNIDIKRTISPAVCINSGCVKTTTIATNTTLNGLQTETGTGNIYYLSTTGPCSVAQNISNTPSLNVCSRQTSACGAPSKWGTATVTNNCATFANACINPLPVSLLYFNVSESREGVLLKWGISQQWDSDYFLIEKSTDGITWNAIGTISSGGTTKGLKEYLLTDVSPENGLNYYKLSEIDTKGNKKEYSIAYIKNEDAYYGFSIFPNPGNGELSVIIYGESDYYELQLTDISGKDLGKRRLKNGRNFLGTILSEPGMYIARLKVGGNYFTQKVIVQ